MSNVFHFQVIVDHVYTCVNQIEFGPQLDVAGIEHIGKQRQVVLVAVIYYPIVLKCQLHAFLLSAKVGKRSQEVGVRSLYSVLHVLLSQQMLLFGSAQLQLALLNLTVILKERREVVANTYTYVPVIESYYRARALLS